ncbi:malate synthase, glyoxysomal-like isoform X4 [Papaver somniferum]|nr:malate synthase, glyoxysomal-like isoform X4 [Papaver somniferum]
MEVSQLLQLRSKDLQREAKVWNCVLEKEEKMAGIERGSIRDIVLIQTLPVSLQIDEILYELRDHSVRLNCGMENKAFCRHGVLEHPES